MSKDIVELAKAASGKLDQKLLKQNESKIAARLYVEAVLDQHAKVKLPQLLALPETEQLMKQYAVSKNMLATALTEARAKRKAEEPKPAVKIPKRKRRSKAKEEGSTSMHSSPDLLASVSANSPSPSGRIENGNIDDL